MFSPYTCRVCRKFLSPTTPQRHEACGKVRGSFTQWNLHWGKLGTQISVPYWNAECKALVMKDHMAVRQDAT
jgi:hypothetical protein